MDTNLPELLGSLAPRSQRPAAPLNLDLAAITSAQAVVVVDDDSHSYFSESSLN